MSTQTVKIGQEQRCVMKEQSVATSAKKIAQRSPRQKMLFKEMSAFWKGRRTGIKPPWRHELIKGVLYVRWLTHTKENCISVLYDWCMDHELNITIQETYKLDLMKYVRSYVNFSRWTLTVEIN